jgi:ubiquinone/menaquinone biosynthesis C-methylase UbiE
MTTYVFDPAWQKERDRLSALESLFDDATKRYMKERGLREGWRCLEIGCGAGGIARWLAEQVGETGQVVATDLDTRFLEEQKDLEVRTHNIVTDPLEENAFDLIHARAVLEHIPARVEVLKRLANALKPGGWLLIEDVDFAGPTATALAQYIWPRHAEKAMERIYLATAALFKAIGADASYGRQLPTALVNLGLVNVEAELHAPVVVGGSEQWTRGTIEQLAGRLVTTGLASQDDIDLFLTTTAEPSTHYVPPLMVSAWGRRHSV